MVVIPDTDLDALLSRSIAAGYDPDVLGTARVLVVGAGALGQNLLLFLALSGVRELLLADRDRFEAHNATRSPLFPGLHILADDPDPAKARLCAHELLRHATHPRAVVRYADAWVEELGDAAFDGIDVVVSAVDTVRARLYLARQAMTFALPFVEGGFAGTSLSFGVFPAPGENPAAEACWACRGLPEDVDITVPCGLAAQAANEAGVIPALQNGAAGLAAFMSEAIVQVLHGNEPAPRRVQLDLRTVEAVNAGLMPDDVCAETHRPTHDDRHSELGPSATAREVLASQLGDVELGDALALPRPFVLTAPCSLCRKPTEVGASLDQWRADPICAPCGGGTWAPAPAGSLPESLPVIHADQPAFADRPLRELGVLPGDRVTCVRAPVEMRVRLAGMAPWVTLTRS